MQNAEGVGYLNEDFRVFHLKDSRAQEFEFHYHDFDKIVIFLSGSTSYTVEGRTYHLQPWDVLFIRHNDIHRPVIDRAKAYERVIIWINPDFLDRNSTPRTDLSRCFTIADERHNNVCRPSAEDRAKLSRAIDDVELALRSDEYGSDVASDSGFLRLMVELNRQMLRNSGIAHAAFDTDPKISRILSYINDNLTADLSIDVLSSQFYMSRYHFMRKFKEVTGYTAHSYIRQKRLVYASELIEEGMNPTEASERSGFTDYSSFLRAFKDMFDKTPRQFAQSSGSRHFPPPTAVD